MTKKKPYFGRFKTGLLLMLFALFSMVANAQIGDVIWEDNFNTFNTAVWNPVVGDGCDIGLCGWGNAELEYYSENNISIEAVAGEAGNYALVLEAKNESAGSSSFTSGKVDTDGNLSVQYGLIEIRMKVPDIETGLWPAAWLLGTANLSWPSKGEIDMMEMGHAAAERTRLGYPNADINSYVGANAIFANEDGSAASIAYDVNYNQPYVANTSMANRFVTYRLYWEPTQMRYTIVDNGVEHDLYAAPLPINADGVTGAFTKPFFFLLNLAVGGNFTDAANASQVSAPLPAKLYIDYVRVSEWNGYGSVETDYDQLAVESGPFGIYTETTPTNNELSYGLDSEIYVWGGTMQEGTTPAYEGSEVIAWETLNANSWFGGGIASLFGRDMSGYVENGSLKFKIKIPADVTFRVGITDNYTNESYVLFPAGETTYGLTRNGEWGQVEIPLADLAGIIAFQNMNYMFAIVSQDGALPASTFQIGLDDIVWNDGVAAIGVTGISVSSNSITLTVEETQQLSATISPANATNKNITWSTSNASVATVNSSGLVTANSNGNATITVTTADGGYTATTSVNVSSVSTDFKIQAEDYTAMSGIQTQGTADVDGGDNVGWINSGDYMEYTVNIPSAGTYTIDYRVASPSNGGDLTMTANGSTVDNTTFASTGGWQVWTTVSSTVSLSAGTQTIRITANNDGWNFNWFELQMGTANNFSTQIEAEDYTAMSGIQTEGTADIGGGENVGWIGTGDWMEYEIDVTTTGIYTVNYRVASLSNGGDLTMTVNGSTIDNSTFSSTGSWQTWTTVSSTVTLSAGVQTIRITANNDGWNINWFEITTESASARTITNETEITESLAKINIYPVPVSNTLNVDLPASANYVRLEVMDLTGKTLMAQVVQSEHTTLDVSNLSKGIFIIRAYKQDASIDVIRFIK